MRPLIQPETPFLLTWPATSQVFLRARGATTASFKRHLSKAKTTSVTSAYQDEHRAETRDWMQRFPLPIVPALR